MLCQRCDKQVSSRARTLSEQRRRSERQRTPLDAVLCTRCSAVLTHEDPVDTMRRKLAQLSRFGLGADDRPLLASARRQR